MANAKLIILSPAHTRREMNIYGETSVGRAPDNLVCIDDQAVSQYHAIIEQRFDGFWLSDLGSTNGTAVNNDPVARERRLLDGDLISIGGVADLTFNSPDEIIEARGSKTVAHAESISDTTSDDSSAERQSQQAVSSQRKLPSTAIAVAVAGLLVAAGVALLAVSLVRDSGRVVSILSPESGSTIRGPQTIRIEAEEPGEIEEVIYLLDGVRFASAEYPPFEAVLDPAQLASMVRNLSSGNHVLTVTVQDKDGAEKPQPDTVLLAFDISEKPGDAGEAKRPVEEIERAQINPIGQQGQPDVASLSRNLAATISGKSWYDFDAEFADEIRRRTANFRVNVMDDASRYRRQIGNAFNSKGLPPAIGFVAAFWQSQFKDDASDQKIGFWHVPRQIALEQGYITADEPSAALKDPKRSAEVAAAYINDLVNAFGGTDHFMYAIACYGLPLNEAAKVRTRLEEIDPNATDRKNLWKMVRAGVISREGAERVANFFAAGIVGENPQAFALNCRPLSSLY